MTPEDSKYATSHEYVHAEGDVGTIGITDYAQKELGDVVFVELPQVGSQLEAGDELGSIESVKAVSELFSPAKVDGAKAIVSRSGYTGEDGFEIFLQPSDATRIMKKLLDLGVQ
ncbi:MAG: glycine cleavage system protein H, partial [Thermoanaerobaculia bacterium]